MTVLLNSANKYCSFISLYFHTFYLDKSIPFKDLTVNVNALCFCMLILSFYFNAVSRKGHCPWRALLYRVSFSLSFIVSPMSRGLSPSDMRRCPQNTVSLLRFLHTTTQVIPIGISLFKFCFFAVLRFI